MLLGVKRFTLSQLLAFSVGIMIVGSIILPMLLPVEATCKCTVFRMTHVPMGVMTISKSGTGVTTVRILPCDSCSAVD